MATVTKFMAARDAAAEALAKAMGEHGESIATSFSDADKASDEAGFLGVAASRAMLPLDLDALAVWTPQKGDTASDQLNAMELAIRDVHRQTGFEHSQAGQDAVRNALWLAVNASTDDAARVAKDGGSFPGDDGEPVEIPGERKAVYAKKLDRTGSGKEGHYQGSEEDARQELENKANANDASPAERAIYGRGLAAVDNPTGLRGLAAYLNLLQKRSQRYRDTLYVNAIRDKLEAYAKSSPAKPVGQVWLPACGKAAKAHREFMKNFNGSEPDAAGLSLAIDAEVDPYLATMGDADSGARQPASKDEQIDACKAALWSRAKAFDRLMGDTSRKMYNAVALVIGHEPPKATPSAEADPNAPSTVTPPTKPVTAPAAAPTASPAAKGRIASGAAPTPAKGPTPTTGAAAKSAVANIKARVGGKPAN